jgi:hypothetical protein
MFQPSTTTVDVPTATSITFVCGHHAELTSNSARRRFTAEGLCPRCWAARPNVHIHATRITRTSGCRYDYFPGIAFEVWPSSAQGFNSTPEATTAIDAEVGQILADHGLLDLYSPGLDLDAPATAARVQTAINEIQALPIHLWIGGVHATRVGLTAGWKS